jgi:hypothetical protein
MILVILCIFWSPDTKERCHSYSPALTAAMSNRPAWRKSAQGYDGPPMRSRKFVLNPE